MNKLMEIFEELPESAFRIISPKLPSQKARKFVQESIDAFVQWVPLSGSSWLFLSFILKQDWLMACLTLPVTAVTTIWAAYSKNFVFRLREIYAERGKKDADDLINFIESLDEAIRWHFFNPENKYLQCQLRECIYCEIEGFDKLDDVAIPLLRDVFVPLELTTNFTVDPSGSVLPNQMGSTGSTALKSNTLFKKQSQQGNLTIWDLLQKAQKEPSYKRLAILAWGGFGKTTLMRHITYTYAENRYRKHGAPKLVPVLLYLRKWRELLVKNNSISLPTLITQYHIPSLPGGEQLDLPEKWAENLLKRGDALVMFDGFDEVPEEHRPVISRWIGQQMRRYAQSTFILTSRPGGYTGSQGYTATDRPYHAVSIKPFNQRQWETFIQQWYFCQERHGRSRGYRYSAAVRAIANEKANELIEQIHKRQELMQMSSNPLLLNMIATFHRFYPGNELPHHRTELYNSICELQLRDRPTSKRIKMLLPFEESFHILQAIALGMVVKTRTTIDRVSLLAWLQRHLNQLGSDIQPEDFLNQIVKVSELLVERESRQYEFSHFSFQGYLAAKYIKAVDREDLLLQHYQKDWWKETIILYSAQIKNPNDFLKHLITRRATNLAYDCMQESPANVDLNLKTYLLTLHNKAQRSRFQDLKFYLENDLWEEADKETYRLIIKAVGKPEGRRLTRSDIMNLPCSELQVIDEYWTSLSDGKFGFSTQRRIYLECGGKLDDSHPSERILQTFYRRLHWQQANKVWLRYHQLGFQATAPRGHLPVALMLSPERRSRKYARIWNNDGDLGHLILLRLDNCGLSKP